jgi:5-methylcytosine-specific restriction protein B
MLYFGKISSRYPEQIKENFYAAGPKGGESYGGIKPGDYVFPIYKGKIDRLWRVSEYTNRPNNINKDHPGVVEFEVIKTFNPVRLSDEFTRYKYFELDLNLLNKSAKSVKKYGFLPIQTSADCPEPTEIKFANDLRSIFVALEKEELSLQPGDIRVTINNLHEKRIIGIHIWDGSNFTEYHVLWDLYLEKNSENGRYSLDDLLAYAIKDKAPSKQKYLESVIKELEEKGSFKAQNPIALYDNILVGRKRSKSKEDDDIVDDLSDYEKYARLLDFNPNLILYGPPGTGKTYSAMRIVECYEQMRNGGVFVPFQEVVAQKRAEFVTFHQAYSYEEFVEGIRPVLADDEQWNESQDLKYRIEDGILKRIANAASVQFIKEKNAEGTETLSESSKIWKISLGARYKEENIYETCREKEIIAIGWLEDQSLEGMTYEEIYAALLVGNDNPDSPKPTHDASTVNYMVNEINPGDVVLVYEGPKTIRDIVVVTGNYFYQKDDMRYPHRRKVKWLKHFDEPQDIYAMNGQVGLNPKTIYQLKNLNMADIKALLTEDKDDQKPEENITPFYLIIDEINRGNVAKIFGELITLIEKDKRDSLTCTLPYSKKPFTLPSNLYIIGTMNTADRSIAMLDTALRRRFAFIELEPDLTVFDNPSLIGTAKVNDRIDLARLLEVINKSVNEQLDRDHRIGHSYFMDIVSLSDLYNVWYYKIIPLLLDYFYNDISVLKGIIGPKFITGQGSVQYLDTKGEDGNISEFEAALLDIIK